MGEIVDAVVLFGELLPEAGDLVLHPDTRAILGDLERVSEPYFDQLSGAASSELLLLGEMWVKDLVAALAPHLPAPDPRKLHEELVRAVNLRAAGRPAIPPQLLRESPGGQAPSRIAPLDQPQPPALGEATDPAGMILRAMAAEAAGEGKGGVLNPGSLTEAPPAMQKALQAFAEGPLQGTLTDGHEVQVGLGGGEDAAGEIFDRPVPLSEDVLAHDRLLEEAGPVIRGLRRVLYPNMEQLPRIERMHTSGALDPLRLHLASFSDVVYRRFRTREQVDRRGRPVLLLIVDGSGSLSVPQMRMAKVLAAAWLRSTVGTQVQVLAGLYHNIPVRGGIVSPLVQWMYHPAKTPSASRAEATRALVSLPERGTGHQADALSMAFMVREARQVGRGSMIYAVLISDTHWCSSFSTGRSGTEEVVGCVESLRAELSGKLHLTVVSLGVKKDSGLSEVADRIIDIPALGLQDVAAVANQISEYVAGVLLERRRMLRRP